MTSTKALNALLAEISLSKEMAVELGDARRTRRVQRVVEALGAAPSAPFPEVFTEGDDCGTFYRLLGNEHFHFRDLLAGHIEATVKRAEHLEEVAVIHDTSEFRFPLRTESPRPGLQRFSSTAQGFFGHASLVTSADGLRCPLGVIEFRPYVRENKLVVDESEPEFWKQIDGILESERGRWLQSVEAAEQRLENVGSVVHLMDREGDSYETFGTMKDRGRRFVIRLAQERKVFDPAVGEDPSSELISGVLARQPVLHQVTAELSPRHDPGRPLSARKKHPARRRRIATLSIRATTVRVPKPANPKTDLSDLPDEVEVNVVEVFEENPPKGEPSVRWLLVTTEPIDEVEDVLRVVDLYRARWIIEEFFKSIKTGCAYRKRQLNSARTLLACLALQLPVAWKLLLMRHLDRTAKDAPATCIVNDVQLTILQNRFPKLKWSKEPTVGRVTEAIAKLGGHRKANGAPGWLILGRGFAKLLTMEAGARAVLGYTG